LPIWPASLVCVLIAIAGTLTSLLVRRTPAVDPTLQFEWRSVTVPREIVNLLRRDRELLLALVVASMFWMLGGIAITTVNALGITQLGLSDTKASLLAAMIGVGIAVGCMLGGYLSGGRINARIVTVGAAGIVVCLLLMSLPGGADQHLLQFSGSIPVLILLGIFTGMFVVPVQVILQLRPSQAEKGRMIAVQNLTTNLGIILGAVLFKLCISLLDQVGGPPSAIFVVTAAIMLPVALFYRPKDVTLD
jgi:acyl-[acyl-carrier-protein]-phospholipid O-acyltransferase/long-chain-fatty-acid--[acyl-carrier-protein] ligase